VLRVTDVNDAVSHLCWILYEIHKIAQRLGLIPALQKLTQCPGQNQSQRPSFLLIRKLLTKKPEAVESHPRLGSLTYCIGKSNGDISQCNSKDIIGPRRSVQSHREQTGGTMHVKQTGLGDLSCRFSVPCQSFLHP